MAVQHVRKVPFQSVSKLDREAQRQLSRNFDTLVAQLVPTGTGPIPWAGQDGLDPPQGWLLCDGQAVSRTAYASLFRVIGTTYGAGDGSTTFNVPNMSDRFARGTHLGSEVGDQGGSATSDMPVHNHAVAVVANNFNTGTVSSWHTHSGTTGWMDRNWNHVHGNPFPYNAGGNIGLTPGGNNYNLNHAWANTNGTDTNHLHGFSTGNPSANHSHNANHGHSVNQSNAGSAGTNNPPYTDFRFIIKT